jgi:hypothetical protein
VSGLFSNPELVRNARISLRPNRMLLIAGICGALSAITGISLYHTRSGITMTSISPQPWHVALAIDAIIAQCFVLVVLGSAQALFSVEREKDKESFDFQRLTRMSEFELTIGKFLGSLVLPLFVVVCIIPAGVVGGIAWNHLGTYVVALVILVFGSLPLQALALLLSVWVTRRGAMTAIGLFLIVLLFVGVSSEHSEYSLNYGTLGPFFSINFIDSAYQHQAQALSPAVVMGVDPGDPFQFTDRFFGHDVSHLAVFAVFSLSLTVWLLLAAKRNIKLDSLLYRAYAPWQGVGFAFYLSLLFVGFFRWAGDTIPNAQGEIAWFEAFVFLLLGYSFLRNRERTRTMIRDSDGKPSFLEALWPAWIIVVAGVLIEAAIVYFEQLNYQGMADWDWGTAVYAAVFFVVWALRDILFLQWRAVSRSKKSLLAAFLYLAAFYAGTGILFVSLGLYSASSSPYISALVPSGVFSISEESWHHYQSPWLVGLVIQLSTAMVFALLHWREIRRMASAEKFGEAPRASSSPMTSISPIA